MRGSLTAFDDTTNEHHVMKVVQRKKTLEGPMRIAVVADTHSEMHPRAIEHLKALEPGAILHAGDIGAMSVVDALEKVAPVVAIRGNIDARVLPDAIVIDVTDGEDLTLRMLLFHIALYGPQLRADAARIARAEKATLVVCGHSHVPFIGIDRGLSIFNPGSIGPRRFQLPIMFGVLEVTPSRIEMHHVDCETGLRWEP